ncbi:MAG: hypothetical protein KatS3mg079_244 [Caloramator sp.]|nr:MAG: hypothetical protein KatS3mg079_244 [Caloramator sp.]
MTSDRAYGLRRLSRFRWNYTRDLRLGFSQISRILDKHADPNMYGPDTALEQDEYGNWYVKGGGKYFPIGQGEESARLCNMGWST